jgi:hypothetical protein
MGYTAMLEMGREDDQIIVLNRVGHNFWKEMAVLKVGYLHSPGDTEKNYEN